MESRSKNKTVITKQQLFFPSSPNFSAVSELSGCACLQIRWGDANHLGSSLLVAGDTGIPAEEPNVPTLPHLMIVRYLGSVGCAACAFRSWAAKKG